MKEPDKPPTQGRIFGYIRASTSKQVDSPDVQRGLILRYIEVNRLEGEPRFFIDPHVSGKFAMDTRKAGKALLNAVRTGDHVIIAKIDRAFRKLRDAVTVLDEFQKKGVRLHVCNLMGGSVDLSSVMGRFMVHMMAAIAELEREFISERVKETQAHIRKRNGHPKGLAPYGFQYRKVHVGGGRYAVRLMPHPGERAIMKQIVQWMDQEGFTLDQVTAHIRERGEVTKQGRAWTRWRVVKCYKAEHKLRAEEQAAWDEKIRESEERKGDHDEEGDEFDRDAGDAA